MLVAIRTEEWNARWVGEMQGLAIFAEVLRAGHEPAHVLQNRRHASADLAPCPTKSMDRRSSKGGNDRCQG